MDQIRAQELADIADCGGEARLLHRNEDEIAGVGGASGIEVNHLARVVARLHGVATHVNRLGVGNGVELWRGGDFAVGSAVNQDSLVVSWGRQADDG